MALWQLMKEKERDGKVQSACKKDRKDCRTQMSGRWLVTNEPRPLVTSLTTLREKKAHVKLIFTKRKGYCSLCSAMRNCSFGVQKLFSIYVT